MSPEDPIRCLPVLVIASWSFVASCAASHKAAVLPPLALAEEAAAAPKAPTLLTDNHFVRDAVGSLTEAQLRDIVQAPVFLEDKARVGIVPVRDGYGADEELPLAGVPSALAATLDDTGLFGVESEVSTDFPATGSVVGLRGREDVAELGELIRKAGALDRRGDPFEGEVPLAKMDFDNLPVTTRR